MARRNGNNDITRRQLLGAGAAGLVGASLPRAALAQASRKPTSKMITPETEKAIRRGLDFLAKRQKTAGADAGSFGEGGISTGVAVCGLGGLAFMCSGDPPGQGKYGKHIDRCVDYLLGQMDASGFLGTEGGRDRMYGHGFATLFLAEAYGMSERREDLGKKLRQSIDLIVKTQNDQGGWRYQPRKADADLSVTICQIMALRAASDAGISVPKATRERAINYVKQSQRSDGGFMYTIPRGHVTFALTAAGLVSLFSAGIYEGDEIEGGLKHLMRYLPGGRLKHHSGHYFYGHYYAVQATWHAGGEYYHKWYPAIRDELLGSQQPGGSWLDNSFGAEYGTAMACIILQMPNNILPIFAE